jgi:hypothetical protein
MFESNVMEESAAQTEELLRSGSEGEALLAALAATLVEYRRRLDPEKAHGGSNASGGNWRTLARWEQLQDQT